MQAAHRLQRSLKAGRPAYGGWQMLPGTNLTRVMCRSATNIDWLLIDLEHGNISDDSMHEIVAATTACGVSPIVRVVEGQHWMIKRALDSGAHVFQVGSRGFEPLLAVEKFAEQQPHGGGVRELTGKEYLDQANDSLVIVVQIERKSALENVKEIAAVPGIDVLFIGPFDLRVSIGHPIVGGKMDQILADAIYSVQEAAQTAGKACGIYCDSGMEAKTWVGKGFLMNSVVTDMIGLRQVVGQAFESAN